MCLLTNFVFCLYSSHFLRESALNNKTELGPLDTRIEWLALRAIQAHDLRNQLFIGYVCVNCVHKLGPQRTQTLSLAHARTLCHANQQQNTLYTELYCTKRTRVCSNTQCDLMGNSVANERCLVEYEFIAFLIDVVAIIIAVCCCCCCCCLPFRMYIRSWRFASSSILSLSQ